MDQTRSAPEIHQTRNGPCHQVCTSLQNNKPEERQKREAAHTNVHWEKVERVVARFAGQGYRCFSDLSHMYNTNQSAKMFVDIVVEGMVHQIRTIGYIDSPMSHLRSWLQNNPTERKIVALEDPTTKMLDSAPVSGPVIALSQFVHVWNMFEMSGQETFLEMMKKHFSCVTGHSQGLVTAVAFASSSSRHEFINNTVKALVLHFLVGIHAQRVVDDYPMLSDGDKTSPMLSVKGISREKLLTLMNEFNNSNSHKKQETDVVYMNIINNTNHFIVSGHPSMLLEFVKVIGQHTKHHQFLHVSVPFHSLLLQAAIEPTLLDASSLAMKFLCSEVNIPVISCHDGTDLQKYSSNTDLLPTLVKLVLVDSLDWPTTMSVATQNGVFCVVDFTPGKHMLPLVGKTTKIFPQNVSHPLRHENGEVEKILSHVRSIAEQMCSTNVLNDDVPLVALGFDSLSIKSLAERLSSTFGFCVSVGQVFSAGCLRELSNKIMQMTSPRNGETFIPNTITLPCPEMRNSGGLIAVISCGMRLPGGVHDLSSLWKMLVGGGDGSRSIPNLDMFDADFFNIPQNEAKRIDPQHRLLLECSWEALERGGYAPGSSRLDPTTAASTGVFVGIWTNDYRDLQLCDGNPIDRYFSSGGSKAMAAGRIAFHFDLGGPTYSIDTACSSSLVAVHLACKALTSGECTLALAGGVNLILAPHISEGFSAAQMLSKNNHCLSFDDAADGYARGEGCAVLALKLLKDALKDGDPILGIISGTAVNSNGRTTSITTPSVSQQQQVIRKAMEEANIQPKDISYIEAHGTGTQLGDMIEMEALQSIFPNFAVGSIKANIGHLESVAGIAGVLKVLAMLQNKSIPPHPTFKKLNKNIAKGGARIITEQVPWLDTKLVAGVSSFGFSGTNAHAIIMEPPKVKDKFTFPHHGPQEFVIVLSAKSEFSLRETARVLSLVAARTKLVDFAFTMNSRPHFRYRLAIVTKTSEHLAAELKLFGEGLQGNSSEYGVLKTTNISEEPHPIFLFPGQGVHFIKISRAMYKQWPTFSFFLDQCDTILRPLLQPPLLTVLLGRTEDEKEGKDNNNNDNNDNNEEEETVLTESWLQASLFSIEWALAQTFLSWGIKPASLIGHSLGELTAACVAGEFSLKDGLSMVVERGQLLEKTVEGAMLATRASFEQLQQLNIFDSKDVCVAAVNGPNNYTISGSKDSVQKVAITLSDLGVKTKWLKVKRGFHSNLLDPILDKFKKKVSHLSFSPPSMKVGNGVQGRLWHEGDGTRGPEYWKNQIRSMVNFMGCVDDAVACNGHKQCYLELGPTSLLSIVSEKVGSAAALLPTIRRSSSSFVAFSLAKLYVLGAKIAWEKVTLGGSIVDLPSYEFDRRHCWLDCFKVRSSSMENTQVDSENKLQLMVRQIVHRIYGRVVGDNENLMSLGMDSLMTTELRLAISCAIGTDKTLPSSFLKEYPTLGHISRFVNNEKSTPATFAPVMSLWHPSTRENNNDNTVPLNGIQHAYWIGKQSIGGSGGHLYREYEVSCKLDVELLKHAINEMIRRHQVLRAVVTEDGLLHILTEVPNFTPTVIKSSDITKIEDAREHLKTGPNIHLWPLFDVVVVQGDSNACVMAVISLFLLDGYSETIISDELFGYFTGHPPQMSTPMPTQLQYIECLNGLDELRHSAAHEKAKDYWKSRIDSFSGRPELPVRANSLSQQLMKFEHHECRLNREHWSEVKKICVAHGTTANTLLLSLYIEILARWSQNKCFAVTVMMSRRTTRVHKELEHVLGNLSSTLLISANRENSSSSLEYCVHQTANEVATALDNSAMDGLEVVQEINRQQKRPFDAYAPFAFSSVVGVKSGEKREGGMVNTPVKRTYSCVYLPHTWMDLQTSEEGGELLYSFDVLKDMFPSVVVEQMVAAYGHLLTAVLAQDAWKVPVTSLFKTPKVANPVSPPCEVPQKLLYEPFLEKVKHNPTKTAVIDGVVTLSYVDLFRYSHLVAVSLRLFSGVVAVLLPKGWRQVVTTVGILRAHLTYMPLDPKLPKQRLEYLFKVSGATAVISDDVTLRECCFSPGDNIIDIDKVIDIQNNSQNVENISLSLSSPPISAMDTAYLLYTSGSTGIPKGVCCHHLGAYNTCMDLIERFQLNELDLVFSLSSLSFDLSVFDIFGMLSAGGTIVMPSTAGMLEPELWLETIEKYHITVWNSVPAFMDLLLTAAEHCHRMLPASLRLVMMSGDLVPLTLPQRIRTLSPLSSQSPSSIPSHSPLHVICLGGATEAAIWSNMYDTNEDVGWSSVPYGRPLRNQTMLILDNDLNLCEEWVTGVIHIGGVGVANGYLNDEQQTSKQFLETKEFGRLFRTGDLGRLRDGLIEILGREDSQVKINGFRIELGEIERTAGRFVGVEDCCVVVSESRFLAAFVVPTKQHNSGDFSDLQDYLKERLPHYMVPNIFVNMESLPLTSNGKIDRKTLTQQANEQRKHVHCQSKKLPKTEKEALLYSAISQVLCNSDFGIEHDLFELGSDSITLLNIVGELRKNNIKLKISDIFANPTISKLATVIVENITQSGDNLKDELFHVIPHPEDGFLPFQMIGIQIGYWIGMYVSDSVGGINNHFYREYEVEGLCLDKMEMAVNRLIDRHPMLRAVVTEKGEIVQLNNVPYWKLPIHKIDGRENFDLLSVRNRILCGPDPHKWPLWQLEVYDFGDDHWYIILDTSIMMLDGVAGGILVKEFLQFYIDGSLKITPLELSFRDYALAHKNLVKTSYYHDAKDYWLNRIDSLPPCPSLPLQQAHPQQQPDMCTPRHFQHFGGRMSSELWTQLQHVCTSLKLTPTMMICTLYSEVISRWSHNHHFLITIMHTKRWPVHPEVNLIVGNFSQTVLLEVDMRDTTTCFETHCRQVTKQLTSDLDHAAFTGTDVGQEINRKRGTQFQAVSPFAFTSTLSFDGLSTIPDIKDSIPFSGRRIYSLVTVPHTWMDHQVAEDCGELLYNFDVLEGIFEPNMVQKMVGTYEMLLHALCDPNSWQNVSIESLFAESGSNEVLVASPFKPEVTRPLMKTTTKPSEDRLPQTILEKAVASEFANVLHINPSEITMYGNFFDLGGNSLSALQLIMSLKAKNQIITTAAKFFENPTVSALTSMDTEPSTMSSSLVCLRKSATKDLHLFLIHAAGASVLSYRPFVQHLHKFAVYGVDDGSILDDEVPFAFNSIDEVSIAYTRILQMFLQQNKLQKCMVGGWSFGGVVAIEVTRRLEAMGFVVSKCILFDSPVGQINEEVDAKERDKVNETLLALSNKIGSGATRAIAHFNHCTKQLNEHKLSLVPQLHTDIIHFIADETTLQLDKVTKTTSLLTTRNATHHFVAGSHFTMLSDINASTLAAMFEAQILEETSS